jgi:HNH endonuclease
VATHIAADLRRLVARRAAGLCEYCLIHENDTFFGCQVDHIISEKHAGPTSENNLAYACVYCNRYKGSDIASVLPGTYSPVRFFNPRTDAWGSHLRLDADGVSIIPLTAIGEVTVRILGFNHPERLMERSALKAIGRYPTDSALHRILAIG